MILSEYEKQSAVWLKLQGFLNGKLESCRKQNDGDLSPEQTSRLRGRIAALKEILSLNETVQAEPDA